MSHTSSLVRGDPPEADVVIEPDDAEVVPVLVGRHGRAGIGVAVRRLLQRDDLRLLRLPLDFHGGCKSCPGQSCRS